ncbi:unnamed protein product [Arabis nemorensis]|uniref:Uncharacterized protein n=1 Tax=Arabis nemorensis TaxID=586526 RepID=A0A565C987_9BRAS|nr:unnamed protein product [Arabis nemorensis]
MVIENIGSLQPFSLKIREEMIILRRCVYDISLASSLKEREIVPTPKKENGSQNHNIENSPAASLATTLGSPPNSQKEGSDYMNGMNEMGYST